MSVTPLFELEDASVRIRDRRFLEHTSWAVMPGQHWVVIGPNGAGKTTLLNTIAGHIPVVAGHARRSPDLRVNLVGPELYRRYLQDETRRRILWSPVSDAYPVTTARMIIHRRKDRVDEGIVSRMASGLDVEHLLDRPVGTLSTGEIRKTLLIAAVADRPELLLLDEPFDGLDVASRQWFAQAIGEFLGSRTTLILATHRSDEIVEAITDYVSLRDGRLVGTGAVNRSGGAPVPGFPPPDTTVMESRAASAVDQDDGARGAGAASPGHTQPLIECRDVTVRYNGRAVIDGLNWTMRRGENWCISGPNGSGKTTLLNLVCGDNLQAYSNDIRLFGRKRGSGESIWDIKREVGYVTPLLQVRHDTGVTVGDVVTSGFFDSIGLYRRPSADQREIADSLCDEMGLTDLVGERFDRLSSGQRALALITRAMIKKPKILILDEPCDGLDPARREEILRAIERIGRTDETDLLYVTHRREEIPACITHHLKLGHPGPQPQAR